MNAVIQESKLAKFREGLVQTTLPFSADVLQNAQSIVASNDFPTTRNERWKYTRVTKIANKQFNVEPATLVNALNLPLQDAYNLVFVNGFFQAQLSSTDVENQLTISTFSQGATAHELGGLMKSNNDVFAALNTLYATDGVVIRIPAKTVLNKPIQLVHVITGTNVMATTRNVIIAEKFSEATIAQVFLAENAADAFTNTVTEVVVEENAKLVIDKIQQETENCFHISNEYVRQDKHSNFTINTMTLDGGFVRNNLFIDVDGENVETHLNSAYVLKGNQHVDNHTTVDHLQPNCESNELYKGVVDDQATAVFNGKVFVRKDAQKINAYQSNGNVLLSDTASINSKPELEIYADDVKCSHGSTTGQLDEEAIFYLRARGLSEKSARALMVTAFIGDVIDKIENEAIVEYVHDALKTRFGWNF